MILNKIIAGLLTLAVVAGVVSIAKSDVYAKEDVEDKGGEKKQSQMQNTNRHQNRHTYIYKYLTGQEADTLDTE
ncbi:hypothetical protein ACFLZ1_03595 [Patescibacteria group bacterium]